MRSFNLQTMLLRTSAHLFFLVDLTTLCSCSSIVLLLSQRSIPTFCLSPQVVVLTSSTESHSKANVGMSLAKALDTTCSIIRNARTEVRSCWCVPKQAEVVAAETYLLQLYMACACRISLLFLSCAGLQSTCVCKFGIRMSV
jgi:hypothetical protein